MATYLLSISLFLVFLIIILCWFFKNSFFNQSEGMNNTFYNFYMNHFNRAPDPISSKYYMNKNENTLITELTIYKNQVEKGLYWTQSQGIVFCGLIRNAEDNIPFLKSFYNTMKSICKKSVFIILENDSTDNTRQKLLEWKQQDPTVVILCDYNQDGNVSVCSISGHTQTYQDKTPHVARIRKLAYLRNIYIDYITHYLKLDDFQYMCVMDLDLSGSMYMDGVLHSFYQLSIDSGISAIACNGMVRTGAGSDAYFKYYDSFAFVELGEPHEWSNEYDKYSHDEDVLNYVTKKYQNNMNLDEVTSAFGGFCIYNLEEVLRSKARYSYSKSNKLSCEHSHFHLNLKKIVVNPRMIFLIHSV